MSPQTGQVCTGSLACMCSLYPAAPRAARRPGRAAVLQPVHRLDLPGRPVAVRQAALLDDRRAAGRDSPASTPQRVQALVRPSAAAVAAPARSRAPRRHPASTAGVDAVPGGDVEVLLGRGERHLRPHRTVAPRPARGPARSRTRRWPSCRPPSARPAAPGSPPAGAARRRRRRRPGRFQR